VCVLRNRGLYTLKSWDHNANQLLEREVKKANRELSSLLNSMDGPLTRVEVVQKRYTELLSEMKRTEREHQKSKKRGDQLQKEKDAQRSELNKVTTMRDKLDKLSRDFAKENKKLKDELHKMESTESAAREELHHRLEELVYDVDSCIAQQHQPEPQNQADVELDELCVTNRYTFDVEANVLQVSAKVQILHRSVRVTRAAVPFPSSDQRA
jgi:chromosome segregation ATPase